MKIDPVKLGDFLSKANKNTYANVRAPKSTALRPASRDYHFEEGDLVYHDTYFGARDFIGEEIVYQSDLPVWGMNYYGFVVKTDASTDEVYAILRTALRQEYSDILPVRGPRSFKEGDSEYRNTVDGDLSRFSGIEEIYIRGELVSRCWYHGGAIE